MMPIKTIKMLQTDVKTGRLINRSDNDMIGPQLEAPVLEAAAILTGINDLNRAVLLTTT